MRRFKSIFVMILILSILLFSTIIGIIVTGGKRQEEKPIVEESIVIPETFVGNIDNNIGVPSEIVDLIVNYNDDYYASIYSLNQVSTANYFNDEIAGAISDYAIKLLVESRKLYDFDFTLSKAHYDLKFTDYYLIGNEIHVGFLMDDYMNFLFLNDICSESFDIENSMIITKVNEEYKIVDYDKTQGYYLMFYENEFNSIKDVEDIYGFYFRQISNVIDNEKYLKQSLNSDGYIASKTYEIPYDRDKAVAYADKYYHSRNDDWYDFSLEGGNCQNYASQCLIAGGMLMDYDGDCWYFDSVEVDERTTSWLQVPNFYNYCLNNSGSGLVVDSDINIFYAEPGDIVQVGISAVSHSTIVTKIIDGHILLNSNSIDMRNWPIEAYTYPTRKLIKIIGSNH